MKLLYQIHINAFKFQIYIFKTRIDGSFKISLLKLFFI